MIFPPRTLTTGRLHLRLPTLSDTQAVFSYTSDPVVSRCMSFRTQTEPAEAEAWIKGALDAWGAGSEHRPWIIEHRATGEVLGAIGAGLKESTVSVGYLLRQTAWGKGFVPEALAAVRDAAFADPRVVRFQALHDTENPASGRVLEKVGLRREGLLRGHSVLPNLGDAPRDVWMWAMVRGDAAPIV